LSRKAPNTFFFLVVNHLGSPETWNEINLASGGPISGRSPHAFTAGDEYLGALFRFAPRLFNRASGVPSSRTWAAPLLVNHHNSTVPCKNLIDGDGGVFGKTSRGEFILRARHRPDLEDIRHGGAFGRNVLHDTGGRTKSFGLDGKGTIIFQSTGFMAEA
jgi:hypothetical protein